MAITTYCNLWYYQSLSLTSSSLDPWHELFQVGSRAAKNILLDVATYLHQLAVDNSPVFFSHLGYCLYLILRCWAV
jgi:hypothetical protein